MHRNPDRLLDAALPDWDVVERHRRVVQAPAHAVWRALREVPSGDLPLTRGLMRIRMLGRGALRSPDRSALDALPPGRSPAVNHTSSSCVSSRGPRCAPMCAR